MKRELAGRDAENRRRMIIIAEGDENI